MLLPVSLPTPASTRALSQESLESNLLLTNLLENDPIYYRIIQSLKLKAKKLKFQFLELLISTLDKSTTY